MRAIPLVTLLLTLFVPSARATAGILLQIEDPPVLELGARSFGYSVANVGDVDVDGRTDFVVGMPGPGAGYAYLFQGSLPLDGTPDLTHVGTVTNRRLGTAVEALGDINADGWPDYAVAEFGRVFVFAGGPAFDAVPDLEFLGDPSTSFGRDLAGGRDLTGDGFPDLAVAAPNTEVGGVDVGQVLIYKGGPGLDAIPDLVLDAPPGAERFGYHLESGSDVDGLGTADLVVYGNHWDDATPDRVWVYAGGPTLGTVPAWKEFAVSGKTLQTSMAVLDLDGDGRSEVVLGLEEENQVRIHAGDNLADTPDRILFGRQADEFFGRQVAAVGDVDGDGDDDLAVGARGTYPDHLRGILYVYAAGVSLPLTPILRQFGPNSTGRFAGGDMVGLGDIDDDGEDELLVGAGDPGQWTWVVDKAYFDCNNDGIPDRNQIVQGGPGDCDADGIPDACQVSWAGEDCDADGVPDVCQIRQDPTRDCDLDGTLDSCEIEADPALDCDANGILDACEFPDPAAGCGVSTVALYTDSVFQENRLSAAGVGPIGVLRLVLRLPPGSPPLTWFQVRVEPPAGVAVLEPLILVPGAYEGDPAPEEIVLSFTTPVPVPPDGILEIAEIPLLALDPMLADAVVALVASQSGAALPLWSDPMWADESTAYAVDRAFGAWINPAPTAAPGPERTASVLEAYPNPFNPRVNLRFELPEAGFGRVSVLDIAGRLIAVVAEAEWTSGTHEVIWDGRDARGSHVASGTYFAVLRALGEAQVRKVVLVR